MEQPPYLNQMVLLETGLEPRALLQACQAIERREGRERTEHWGRGPWIWTSSSSATGG